MELGIYTLGELAHDPRSGATPTPEVRTHQLLELARRADQGGLDVIGVGEHHTPRFVASATATILAAMASVTNRIRLTSATTLLGAADPVRTYEEFATADLASRGRVELIVGRGALTDPFELFGYHLDDYDALFTEKLQLLSALNGGGPVTWTGRFRAALRDVEVSPRSAQARLPIWIAAGSPATVIRVAALGYPLVLQLLGGTIGHYAGLATLYRSAWAESGRPVEECRVAITSHLFVGESSRQVQEEFLPRYAAHLCLAARRPLELADLDQLNATHGVLIAGTSEEVTHKLQALVTSIGCDRYLGQLDAGGLPFELVAGAVERYATIVAPAVRDAASPALSTTQHFTPTFSEEAP